MKRARPDADTDALVRSVLAEEAAHKAAKKGGPSTAGPSDRGASLADLEAGGPVKESEAGMAAHRRAAARRAAKAAGSAAATELGRVEDAEEELAPDAAAEADAGAVPLEPFNMKDEREAGAVDADGNLVRRPPRRGGAASDDGDASGDDDDDNGGGDGDDAWLASASINKEAAAAAAARAAAAAAADAAPEITPRDVARLKALLADILAPGETVAAALRRLRPAKGAPAAARIEFDRATDAAAALAGAPGVGDAFALTRDECAAAAAMFGGGADEDDMFADDGAGPSAAAAATAAAAPPPPTTSGPPGPPPPPPPGTATDFSAWPVAELARYVREAAGGARTGAVEKSDLVAAAAAAEAAASARRAEAAEQTPPPSYVRVAPGWWWSDASGLWWHAASGAFSADGCAWWVWDAGAGAFVARG